MISYTIYKTTRELPYAWDTLVKHDILLQSRYLKGLEGAVPNNIQLVYVGIFKDAQLVGIALIQHVQLYLNDMFRKTDGSRIQSFLKNRISKVLKGDILVVGNLTHTGQHGLFFTKETISQQEFIKAIYSALSEIKIRIKKLQKKNIRLILFKDYFIDASITKVIGNFNVFKLHEVSVQPSMILLLKANWLTSEDYKSALTKKYRDRYKSARKKFKGVKVHDMDLATVRDKSIELHALYKNVSSNAKFNTFILSENHFYNLKLQLKDNFKVFGYYIGDRLIGFYTLILNNSELETYFLGYHPDFQRPKQLYLNMLYDMLDFGIQNKFKSVVYARTAMEIKSSVGAEPYAMVIYIKHTNTIINKILKPVFKFMNPSITWEQRNPFKN